MDKARHAGEDTSEILLIFAITNVIYDTAIPDNSHPRQKRAG